VLRGIFEFLGLEPVSAGDRPKAGADERYFRQWHDLQRDPRIRAYLTAASLRYERRTRALGYSLFRPQSGPVAELNLGRCRHPAQGTV
jgi:hypothetical protein